MRNFNAAKPFFFLIGLVMLGSGVTAAIPASERAALIALYNSTNGDGWKYNFFWKTPPLYTDGFAMPGTENTWYGVFTDSGNTTVSYIVLSNNQLTGSIPAELGNLAQLQGLSLFINQLSGSIPPELGNLTQMQSLNLEGNHLTGSIPASLGNLTQLQGLSLSVNQLSGSIPPELGNLAQLQGLSLFINQLSGSIPASLGNLTQLQDIYLFSNQLTGNIPASLGNLTQLKYLYLNDNQLTGSIPVELGNLTQLEYLYLEGNQLTGSIPTTLTSLTALSYLDINYNGLFTDDTALTAFLNSKQPGWADTQTIAPSNAAAAPSGANSITVSWTPIIYTGATGGYRVSYSQTPGGPYTFFGQTANKSASSLMVNSLTPSIPYYFVVQTRTNPHSYNANTVTSDPSSEASASIFQYTVTFQTDGTAGATLTGTTPQGVIPGANCTPVTANDPVGYHLVNWTGTGGFTSTSNTVTVTNITQDMTITANFAINQYTVIFQTDGTPGATLTGTTSQTVNHGDNCTQITANAPAGYHFSYWSSTGGFASDLNPVTVTNVTRNMTITAHFAISQCTVTFQTDGTAGATLTGATLQTVDPGGDCTAVTANEPYNYHFTDWTGTDGFTSTANPLTVTNVTQDITITAHFRSNTPLLGDVNDDGLVNWADVEFLADILADNLPVTERADLNGDGQVDILDLYLLAGKVAGLF